MKAKHEIQAQDEEFFSFFTPPALYSFFSRLLLSRENLFHSMRGTLTLIQTHKYNMLDNLDDHLTSCHPRPVNELGIPVRVKLSGRM